MNKSEPFFYYLSPMRKILILSCFSSSLFWINSLLLSIMALFSVLLLYSISKISFMIFWQQLKFIMPMTIFYFIWQLITGNWYLSLLIITRLSAVLLLASFIMLTTKTSEMITSFKKGLIWLKFLGINPSQISLTITLVLRFIPMLSEITKKVKEAQEVRGIEFNIMAIVIPTIIRMLRIADNITMAMESRGYEKEVDL